MGGLVDMGGWPGYTWVFAGRHSAGSGSRGMCCRDNDARSHHHSRPWPDRPSPPAALPGRADRAGAHAWRQHAGQAVVRR